MKFQATLHPVKGRGAPPEPFLTELVTWAKDAPDEIFAPNDDEQDVFNRLAPLLGPWESPLHRRAAMCELLRCLAGFESSWHWREGVDTTNKTSMANVEGQETGIFQVSFDSLNLDDVKGTSPDLHDCVRNYCDGMIDVHTFIDRMKSNHTFALEYGARLLRNNFFWDGPIKRHEIDSSLHRPAVEEFKSLLA